MQTRHNWPKFLVILASLSLVVIIWLAADGVREAVPSRPLSSVAAPRLKAPRLELAKGEQVDKRPVVSAATNKLSNVRIAKWSWLKSKEGSVMTAAFTLENDNEFPVMDIQISCNLWGKSETVLDTVIQTIYDEIPPWDAERFTNIDFGFIDEQSDSALCSIVDVR